MHLTIHQELCMRCGFCVESCPELFAMTDNNASVTAKNIPENLISAVNEIIECCPAQVIEIMKE